MKITILFTLSLLVSPVFASGYPYPYPDPGQPAQEYSLCNIDYHGDFERGGGPLTFSLRANQDGSTYVDVVVYYQDQTYYGSGVCDQRGIDFTLENGYRHIATFEFGNRGARLVGGLFFNGRQTDRFAVYEN